MLLATSKAHLRACAVAHLSACLQNTLSFVAQQQLHYLIEVCNQDYPHCCKPVQLAQKTAWLQHLPHFTHAHTATTMLH